ncbi:MAG: GerMN domain-containing protein [Propionicimonas sp.]
MRSTSWVAAPMALLLMLAGCATVPTSGPVEHHTPQAAGVNSGVHVDPLPPANGASQLLVVEGFLHAMGVYQPNYAVARQYLTGPASSNWSPESGVQIYADGPAPSDAAPGVLVAPLVGSIDGTGVYSAASGQLRHDFGLVKDEAGQWRIAHPPNGLLVSRYLFSISFVSATLHFLDSAGQVLVPDPRFFPAGDQAPAAVVRAQLAGPSAWLAPVVAKVGTDDIPVEAVTLDDDGLADIRLGEGGPVSAAQQKVLLAELAFTMTALSQVTAVQVTSGGQVWKSEFGLTEVGPQNFANLSPENSAALRVLFTVRDQKLARMRDPANWTDFVTVDAALDEPEQIAVRSDLAEVAATSAAGTRLDAAPIGPGKPRQLRVGVGLLRPDYARNGELWSFASSGVSSLRVYVGDAMRKVDLKGAPQGAVVAAKLAADGARIAVILRKGEQTAVGLAAVVRERDTIALTGWRTVDVTMNTGTAGSALDLGWYSQTELAVLQTGSGGETSIIKVSQDGATATDIGPSNSASLGQLAVVPQRQPVALGSGGGAYRFETEFNWTLSIIGVQALVYSG